MLKVQRSSAPLGAEILGVDLSTELDDAVFREIVGQFHEHEVVFFRNQRLTPDQHVAFSRRFGELEHHVSKDCCRPGFPELFVVSNVLDDGKPIGSQDAGLFWHSDLCYLKEPSRASLFYAREVPLDAKGKPVGDTMFASGSAAYAALPAPEKHKLANLKAVNSYAKGYYRDRKSGARKPLTEEQQMRTPDVEHPVVRTHPCTGKKCLFVNEGYTAGIVGMNAGESDALLARLVEHSTRPEFVYRHQWRGGDLLVWDNRPTPHPAGMEYSVPHRQPMERASLFGTAPVS